MPTMLAVIAIVLMGMVFGALAMILWMSDKIVLGGKVLSRDSYQLLRWLGRRRTWLPLSEAQEGVKLDDAAFNKANDALLSFGLVEGRIVTDDTGIEPPRAKLALTAKGVTLEEALTQLGDPFRFLHEP